MVPDSPEPCPTVIHCAGAPSSEGGGRIKVKPDDFVVEEIPAYEPCGEGDHVYLFVRKTDVSGPLLVRELARQSGVNAGDIGVAGVKDRRAVTSQWVSLPVGAATPDFTSAEIGAGGRIEILQSTHHTNKLRTGHLAGNRFSVRVAGRSPDGDQRVAEALEFYESHGFPNTFGPQRFGGGAVEEGLRFLSGRGRSARGRRLKFALSAVQSWIFNHWLRRRVASGTLTTALQGDVLKRRDTGGLFVCERPAEDTERLQAGEVIVTGPMMGSRPTRATAAAALEEMELVSELGIHPDAFKKMGRAARGTRRPAVAWPTGVDCSRLVEALEVKFTLDSGVYATVLLELICGSPLTSGPEESPVAGPRS